MRSIKGTVPMLLLALPMLLLGGNALTHTSNPVSVTLTGGTATQLAVTTQPGGGTSQTPWSTQPVVAEAQQVFEEGRAHTTRTPCGTL